MSQVIDAPAAHGGFGAHSFIIDSILKVARMVSTYNAATPGESQPESSSRWNVDVEEENDWYSVSLLFDVAAEDDHLVSAASGI